MGATTIWERWDSMLPDGSINPGEMTSFNHYALGAVADWMHRVVGGLAPGAPGYRVINVAPRPGGGIASAKTTHRTPYGRAEVSWRRSEDRLTVDVVVPVGTTAVVTLPDTTPTEAGPANTTSKAPTAHPRTTPSGARRSAPETSSKRVSLGTVEHTLSQGARGWASGYWSSRQRIAGLRAAGRVARRVPCRCFGSRRPGGVGRCGGKRRNGRVVVGGVRGGLLPAGAEHVGDLRVDVQLLETPLEISLLSSDSVRARRRGDRRWLNCRRRGPGRPEWHRLA